MVVHASMFGAAGQFQTVPQPWPNMVEFFTDSIEVQGRLPPGKDYMGKKYKIVEVVGRTGNFLRMFTITPEGGARWDVKRWGNNIARKVNQVQFKLRISTDSTAKGAVVTFFKNGKYTISGGYIDCNATNGFKQLKVQPRSVLGFLLQAYSGQRPKKTFRMTSITGRESTDIVIGRYKLYEKMRGKLTNAIAIEYPNVEMNTTHIARFVTDNIKIRFTGKGNVQIMGPRNIGEFQKALSMLKVIKNKLKNTPGVLAVRRNETPKPSFKGRIVRRRDGNIAPNVKRAGVTCPKNRQPVPYSFDGKCAEGFFVRPNPQKMPCCYKIPKSKSYMRKKLANNYAAIGVPIPENVRTLFNIKNVSAPNISARNDMFKIEPMKAKIRENGKMVLRNTIRIGSRQCERYTKEELVDIVSKLGLNAAMFAKKPKWEICEYLAARYGYRRKGHVIQKEPSRMVNGKAIRNNGKIGKRVCTTYPRATLVKFANELKIKVPENAKKSEICKMIMNKKNNSSSNSNLNSFAKQLENELLEQN